MCHLGISPAVKILAGYKPLDYLVKGGGGGGGGGQPKILGKLGLEIGFTRKPHPYRGEVSESLRLLRSTRRPRPQMGVACS